MIRRCNRVGKMMPPFLSRFRLERILVLVTVFLGLLHAWIGRYAMNPDGISYLDVGESFFRRDWTSAVNAYWSPLYPWMLGIVVGMVNPSPMWEFPVVHMVNFVVFVIALLAFHFFLQTLLARRRERILSAKPGDGDPLPEWALLLVAYSVFWWIALEVETLYDVSPDLAVLACLSLAAGMLLSLRPSDTVWKFALFGLILGVGYWTKAILFPIGIVTLVASYLYRRTDKSWQRGMIIASLVFLLISAPFILLLSKQKGRFTFGDSGKLAYAWCVSPRAFYRNWQGESGSGTPMHPTRQVLRHPPVFEFDGPVVGTYPPWTDPSYWDEGVRGRFLLKAQTQTLATNLASEARLLLRSQPALAVGALALALLSGRRWWARLREIWPLIFISGIGMALYLPILVNDRYLGGFLLLLFTVLLAAAQSRREDHMSVTYISLSVFVVMALGTVDYTARIVTNHLAIPGNGPNSTLQDVVAAEQLWHKGVRPGDKIAVIADGTGAYWARLAKLRIVAEIMDTNHGTREFWSASEDQQQDVYRVFARAHAKLVVTSCPICPPAIPEGWQRLEGTPYCVRTLEVLGDM
jgi:hypothetical protein